ncbi:hypothetical protein BCV70DRAFT_13171 [Testicularia cyperi]|uniref:FYVE-type domain-containing protein n=1 Tax=Testicularia cyperi TaxID=1882483 RepID=A0A317XZ28_9BASI|nr:hypothetical protein BCV70DRAFT_13171 [Testicularia cyperi]
MANTGAPIPAHVNSYATLLAAKSKLGPISVPQGVALANAAGMDPQRQPTLRPTNDGRATVYRSGFQPKGVVRVRTAEYAEMRRKKRSEGEMEEQRMDRRLAKLIAIHFPTPAVGSEKVRQPQPRRGSGINSGGGSSFLDFDLDELRRDPGGILRKSGADLWSSFKARGRGEDPAIRAAEQSIVMWQDDAEAKVCPICETSFGLTVRKHHCRLCGRVVCASPHLAKLTWAEQMDSTNDKPFSVEQRMALQNKCSGSIIADPISGRIEDVREGPLAGPGPTQQQSHESSSNGSVASGSASTSTSPHRGVRICKDCRSIVRKRQYMHDDVPYPLFVKLYEALLRVQREIEQSLPEFQEMVLGLQKQDHNAALGSSIKANIALQRDAVQARKQLLANFATYDELAKRIRALPVDSAHSKEAKSLGGTDAAQERVQHAIFTRANLFLQQNMLPLQSLPKPGSKTATGDGASDSSVSTSNSPRPESPRPRMSQLPPGARRGNQHNPQGSVSSLASLRSLFGGGGGVNGRGSLRSNSTVDLAGGFDTPEGDDSQMPPADPAELKEQLKVLLEQEKLVAEYVESAAKARKFDDARTLKKSHEELCKEILRIQRRLVVKGQGK